MSILRVFKFTGVKPNVDDLVCLNPDGTVSKIVNNKLPILGFCEVAGSFIHDDEILVLIPG